MKYEPSSCESMQKCTVNNSDWVLSSSKLMSLKIVLFWETLRGEVMGNPKKNHKVGLSVVSKLIWPASLPAISTLGSTFGRRPACNLGNIYHPPKFMPHLAAVSRWTSDLPCNMNPALLLLGLFFSFFFLHGSRWWSTYTHVRWHSCCSTPRSHLASSLNFSCFSLPIFTHLTPASSQPKGALESGFYLDLT